jgi:hypothetical protein
MPTNNAYVYIKPNENAIAKMGSLRGEFTQIDAAMRVFTPQGRYQSLALTALEEAAMWAMKAISHG